MEFTRDNAVLFKEYVKDEFVTPVVFEILYRPSCSDKVPLPRPRIFRYSVDRSYSRTGKSYRHSSIDVYVYICLKQRSYLNHRISKVFFIESTNIRTQTGRF